MKKVAFALCVLIYSLTSMAQEKIASTDQFLVEEKGKPVLSFSVDQAGSFPSKTIGDVRTVNSKGEEKAVRTNVKGILLKEVLNKVNLNVASSKELNKYVFLLEATDGYKVVLSRNEVFNTENLYLITESNNTSIRQSPDRIEILALSEPGKGHIYIKGLKKITIIRID
jgi:hypothetical protein